MTKERLRHYKDLKNEIIKMRARIDEIESSVTSLRSPSFEGLPSAPNKNKSPVESAVASLIDLKSEYLYRLNDMVKEQKTIEEAIASLPGSTERQLMLMRYIDGLTWEDICTALEYSWAHTHRIHALALRHISEV